MTTDVRPSRLRLVMLLLACVALVCAACGSPGPDEGSAAPPPGGAGYPVQVTGKFGTTTIPAAPQRVVAMSWTDTDIALSLGVRPVGVASVPEAGGLQPWTVQALGAERPTTFPVSGQDPIEQVAALRPDLILATKDFNLSASYPMLSQIAPVVTYDNGPNSDAYDAEVTKVATALGKPEQAGALVARNQSAIAAQRAAHPELAGKTFSYIIAPSQQSVYTINTERDVNSALFAGLGMRLSPPLTTLPSSSTPNRAQLSLERLAILDADVVIATGSPSQMAYLNSNPIFSQLPAVRRGAFIQLDLASAEALAFPSPLSVPYALGQVVPKLSAAVAPR